MTPRDRLWLTQGVIWFVQTRTPASGGSMKEKDLLIMGGLFIFFVIALLFYLYMMWSEKERAGAPDEVSIFLTKNFWAMLPLPVLILVLEFVTGFAGNLYNLVNDSEPTTTVGVVVGGVPLMGSPAIITICLCILIAIALGSILTVVILDVYFRINRKRK